MKFLSFFYLLNFMIKFLQDDTDVSARVLNVSVAAKRADLPGEQYYSEQYLKERIYLHRGDLETLATVKVGVSVAVHDSMLT